MKIMLTLLNTVEERETSHTRDTIVLGLLNRGGYNGECEG